MHRPHSCLLVLSGQACAAVWQPGFHLPARSTRLRAPCKQVLLAACCPCMYSMNTLWLREDSAFMAVLSTERACAALRMSVRASCAVRTSARAAPATVVGPPACMQPHQPCCTAFGATAMHFL